MRLLDRGRVAGRWPLFGLPAAVWRPVGQVEFGRAAGPARVLRAALAFALILAVGGAVSQASAAAPPDNPSDIPGVPLPGPVVSGPHGGNIYDVVFRLDVRPGSVIVASLSGPAGTDFDLYLFDASATTVVTNVGVVARSTGPTSTESLSYATPIGGRFYININSATPATGTYVLVVQVVADRIPLAGLVLNEGRPRTNSATVAAELSMSGSLSGPARMALSPDGVTWQPWQPFQAVTYWTFSDGDGTKTLWARVESAAGLASAPVSASVVLDTERPGVVAVDPPIGEDLVGSRPAITVTFSEPIQPDSWTTLGIVFQTPGGQIVPGTYSLVSPAVGRFRPATDLEVGALYVITVGPVRDVAGNLVAPLGSWVALVRRAPVVAVATSPPVVDQGQTALLSGRVTAPAGISSLSLEAHRAGSALGIVQLGSVPVAPDGSFAVRVTPSSSTEYRFRVPAVGDYGAATVSAAVAVRRNVWIAGDSPAVVRAGRVGVLTTVAATIWPAVADAAVAFRLERWNATARSWRLVGTLNRRTDVMGRATVAWRPAGSGLFRWRATVASTLDYSTRASAWVRWSIER
jgi:hypothetical protein